MSKIGPLEGIIGEEVSGYEIIPVDYVKGVNSQVVLKFKSGKGLLLGFLCVKEAVNPHSECRPSYFLEPIDA